MITKEITIAIEEIEGGNLDKRIEDLSNWLYGDKKDALAELLLLTSLKSDLIRNLTRELADLRKQEREPENLLAFQMSKPAKKRTSHA